MHEQRLPVEAIRRLSPRQFVISFRSPEIAGSARPGQFVMMSVRESREPLLRRPMAIYRIGRDEAGRAQSFGILIEVHGRGTALLSEAEPGDPIRILGPVGSPFDLPGEEGVEHVMVMGGVGSAPFPFLADALAARGASMRAFIGARTADDLLCVQELRGLEVPVEIATDDGTAGHHGFVTGPLQEWLELRDDGAEVTEDGAGTGNVMLYACGPTPMMRAVHDLARQRRLPLQVSLEAPMACGIGVCLSCVVKARDDDGWRYVRTCREGPVFDSRELVWA